MLDSGARGSKEQIRQLCGMRGLMAKPKNQVLQEVKLLKTLSFLISKKVCQFLNILFLPMVHVKVLLILLLKTADAGYLTRRLVDVSQDVIITEEDCGTLRGLLLLLLKRMRKLLNLYMTGFLGRTSLHDIYHPQTGELIISSGGALTEEIAETIENSPLESVEIRSVLTCESRQGVCAKCYGRNLATGRDG